MGMLTSEIRRTFLDFFKGHQHEVVPASPLVPQNDPTLLFTNAGMVQFKDVFTGLDKRPYKRAASSQKCLRAGGKHNDLENVGYTARHHTFFEMLGNFSFGDYFKEEAISYAWDLLTKKFSLSPERLWITVYAEDEEAATLWRKISGFSDSKILRIPTSDNFWSMGDTGPCGPCTEIFYDHGDHIPGGLPGTPEEDGDRFVEIWNLVFMQFETLPGGKRIDLPKPSVDTGMGLERISAVLQGISNNYETDFFKNIIHASQELTHNPDPIQSHRVIADHLRSAAFLIADGVMPSNEGRGYVLRRIMRRAMRHGHLLGAKEPLLWQLVPVLVKDMGEAYGELARAQSLIESTLKMEEVQFRETLGKGLKLLQTALKELPESRPLPGQVAFTLYDTYGFPLDLTQDVLKTQGRSVDVEEFNTAMQVQKAASRAAWAGSGDSQNEQIWYDLYDHHGATEFLGYEREKGEGKILALVDESLKPLQQAASGETVYILANQTPFYAESGGQIGDAGVIYFGDQWGGVVEISDTLKKLGKLHIHKGTVLQGILRVDDNAAFSVDHERRFKIRANHSATHLLHAALRRVLGPQVTQKGSLVAPDRLRFDFTCAQSLTMAQIREVEMLVNHQILKNAPVHTEILTPEAAMAKGAMALFGEKYGEEVRVLSMGVQDVWTPGVVEESQKKGAQEKSRGDQDQPFSIELCGGTHVGSTGDIGSFKITQESGIAAGIRRIEALTGTGVLGYTQALEKELSTVAAALNAKVEESAERVVKLVQEQKALQRQVVDLKKQLALEGGGQSRDSSGGAVKKIGMLDVLTRSFVDVSAKDLKSLSDVLIKEIQSGVLILASTYDSKVSLVVKVTPDISSFYNAVELVKVGAEILGGTGGGGKPELAQAGGPHCDQIPEAFQAIEKHLEAKMD